MKAMKDSRSVGVTDAKEGTAKEDTALAFCDTYTTHDYEVILDFLYGLFTQEDAGRVRVFDPFVQEVCKAPLITPLMLTQRIEGWLAEQTNA